LLLDELTLLLLVDVQLLLLELVILLVDPGPVLLMLLEAKAAAGAMPRAATLAAVTINFFIFFNPSLFGNIN
jgi:hypothetical protein